MYNCLSAVPTSTTITTLGDDVKDQPASLFTTILGTDNLNSLILGLVTRDLDLSTSLLAKIIDGGTARSDNEPMIG